MNHAKSPVTAIEYYLKNPEKLDTLEPRLKRFFWSARDWHPVVKMNWVTGIISDGLGKLTFPDGTILNYEMPQRPFD